MDQMDSYVGYEAKRGVLTLKYTEVLLRVRHRDQLGRLGEDLAPYLLSRVSRHPEEHPMLLIEVYLGYQGQLGAADADRASVIPPPRASLWGKW